MQDDDRLYPESWTDKRFTRLEALVSMSSGLGCGIAFGIFFSNTLTGRTWLLPGIVIGVLVGFFCTFFAMPYFVIRMYEHRQNRRGRHACN